jgi:hypothetical protein
MAYLPLQEPPKNCILNSENRITQPGVFKEDTTDSVAYFEPSCGRHFLTARYLGINVYVLSLLRTHCCNYILYLVLPVTPGLAETGFRESVIKI